MEKTTHIDGYLEKEEKSSNECNKVHKQKSNVKYQNK